MGHPKRKQVRDLRRKGRSFNEISELTGVAKSTIHYLVKGIQLTSSQEKRLEARVRKGGASGRETIAKMPEAQKREFCRTGGLKLWRTSPGIARENLRRAAIASSHMYLAHELIAKKELETLYGDTFRKEKVAGHYFDFVSEAYLIEHTRDWGKGPSSALDRFEAAKGDTRKKILYANLLHWGRKRQARATALGVEVRDVKELGK